MLCDQYLHTMRSQRLNPEPLLTLIEKVKIENGDAPKVLSSYPEV
jgi:hypothetical protein